MLYKRQHNVLTDKESQPIPEWNIRKELHHRNSPTSIPVKKDVYHKECHLVSRPAYQESLPPEGQSVPVDRDDPSDKSRRYDRGLSQPIINCKNRTDKDYGKQMGATP